MISSVRPLDCMATPLQNLKYPEKVVWRIYTNRGLEMIADQAIRVAVYLGRRPSRL